jgi:hypothetical protein
MGLFGHRAAGSQPQGDPRNRVFGDGSVGGIASGIGKILTYGPFLGVAQEGMNRRRELDDSNMAYKAAMAKRASEPPMSDISADAIRMGYAPGTPQFNDFVTKYRMQPKFMVLGNPETGQTVIDPSAQPQQPSGPPPEAVNQLKLNPAFAPQFDEIFGQGAAASVLGGH